MKILVDTSIWSLALRKKTLTHQEKKIVAELKELIHELRVVIIGPVRQELLSGISDEMKYMNLKDKLQPFDDLPLQVEDYEKAAELFNICRRNGVQGSHIDFLICAASINEGISIFTTDIDFENYKKYINIKLHTTRDELNT
ncbi:MAG: PIN domain-containing protein [Spirochaetia bacterium]|nr:PIN domain-containing protein [Spirochaetia bacterium]